MTTIKSIVDILVTIAFDMYSQTNADVCPTFSLAVPLLSHCFNSRKLKNELTHVFPLCLHLLQQQQQQQATQLILQSQLSPPSLSTTLETEKKKHNSSSRDSSFLMQPPYSVTVF